ncbi:MAG: 7-cyano-7-deazaguanine synthase [Clostridia bacterium]|nr:7-cyano-7-deazaguanine synthase [Clostridia bacterium]
MNDMILILNYSDEFSMEAAKRLRAEHIFCRIVSGMTTADQIREIAPRGVLLTGEPDDGMGVFDAQILELDVPVLALGHASHMLLAALGGASAGAAITDRKAMITYGDSLLFDGVADGERYIPQALTTMLPPDVRMIASAAGCTMAFESTQKKQYGAQFELERNDPDGTAILTNFARDICGCNAWWTLDAAIHEARLILDEAAARGGRAICAVSGGVDSAVAAMIAHQAFGERMTAVFVNTGLMREGEAQWVQQLYEEQGIRLLSIDRSGMVLNALAGKRSTQEKTEVVMRCMREEIERQAAATPDADTLILGDNYTDLLRGGADEEWGESGLKALRPLQMFFKSEICDAASVLGLSHELVTKKPFPALGLGARIVGEVTPERLHAIRVAEEIFSREIQEAGLERRLYKYFPVMIAEHGAMGGEVMILRAVTLSGGQLMPARLPYDLVERTVEGILDKAPNVQRVFYDQTPTQVGKETFQ